MNETSTDYQYATVSGRYTFPKDAPHIMRYETKEGESLVASSTFAVLASGILVFIDSKVLDASPNRFQVRYSIGATAEVLGNVTITYAFREDGPPKLTAALNHRFNGTLGLSWLLVTTDTFAWNQTTAVEFASRSTPLKIGTPDYALEVGPAAERAAWPRILSIDWSDARAGESSVGQISVGALSGPGVIVAFPETMAVVDPMVVGTSTVGYATDFPIQRKTFEYGNRFWAFWYNGSTIAYASSQMSYANGVNTAIWSVPIATTSGPLPTGTNYRGFDVDQRGGTVLVGYITSDLKSMKVLMGTIAGSWITWTGPVNVAPAWTIPQAGVPSVAIGTDGRLWAAYVWSDGVTWAHYYRTNDTGSFVLSAFEPLSGPPADSAARIIALSNGTLLSITSTKGSTAIRTSRYSTSGWQGLNTTNINLKATEERGRVLSAVADDKDTVHLVFKGDDTGAPGIRYTAIRRNDTFTSSPSLPIDTTLDTSLPTAARDANGEVHAFWKYVDGSSFHHIRYSRQLPATGTWSGYSEPWMPVPDTTTYGGLTGGAFASSQVFLLWVQGICPSCDVKFGSVSAPMDLGGQTGQPWNRQGLSPYQSFFGGLGEYISPGSGLLTVKQTDLVLPGRVLSLEISRVFVTPRAFVGGQPTPYLFEEYPNATLGAGWRLNFPWISSQYLHLWDGQMYIVKWNGNDFENHDGVHFLLRRTSCGVGCYTYTLFVKNGIRYQFNWLRQLTSISEPSGNSISLYYFAGRIDYIADTIDRRVSFAYNPNGTLKSVSTGPLSVTYSYQTINGILLLRSVSDGMGRKTIFDHTDVRTPRVLTRITYPTGGKSNFTWSNPAVTVGSDLVSYLVTLQNTQNSTGGSVRSNGFDYTFVNGKVTYAKVTAYEAGQLKGSTVQTFDYLGGNSVTIRRDSTGNQIDKQVTWFGAGAVTQVDTYPGSSASAVYSTHAAYDDWGNRIYARDTNGHETFASFVNTRYAGGFFAPGRLSTIIPGPILHDDFEDRDLSDWQIVTSAGSVSHSNATFESSPPVLKIERTASPLGVAIASHLFTAAPVLVAEATIRAEETNRNHYIRLYADASPRVHIRMAASGWIQAWMPILQWFDLVPYVAKQWYRIGIEANSSGNSHNVWVNGVKRASAVQMDGVGTINSVLFEASCSGCGNATMYVDRVKVMASNTTMITGLLPGQVVSYASLEGFSSATTRATAAGSAKLNLTPHALPYGIVTVYDLEGNVEYASPYRIFWGADQYAYTKPWKAFPVRTTSGFLRATTVYVDEGLPGGAIAVPDQDGWTWSTDNPVNGSKYHPSKHMTGMHQHSFQDASQTLPIATWSHLIQYVHVPTNQYPSEIMLQFRDIGNSWEHRAYWGADQIVLGGGTRTSMGNLPNGAGRWLQLVVKANSVGMNGGTLEGWAYTLHGGRAFWDYSAVGGPELGEIRVSNLSSNWAVDLYDARGTPVANDSVGSGETTARIDLYNATNKVRAFPFEGYFVVKDGTTPVYRSPVITFWGGDTYRYRAESFYPNANIDSTIHDRPACTLEYQTGRAASPQVPIMSCFRYTSQGLLDRGKVNDSGVWRETSYTYDGTYGTLTSVKDPGQNIVSFTYSPAYGRAYVSRASDAIGNLGRYAYDPRTGWALSSRDGRGYLDRYAYDALGRPTAGSRYDLPAAAERLYLDMEWMTEDVTPKAEDLSGQANHGTFTGTAIGSGPAGLARDFNGTTDRIVVADSATLDIGSEWSVSAWIKPDTITGVHRILEKAKLGVSQQEYGLFQNGPEVSFRVWQPGGADHAAASAWGVLVAGQWTHVAGTYKSGSAIRLYVDGVERANSTTFTGSPAAGSASLKIGARESTSSFTEFFDGAIDEVRLFSQSLGASDVLNLSQNSFRLLTSSSAAYDDVGNVLTIYEPTTQPRAAHWDMETTLAGKMEDLAGQGNHGTISGTGDVAGKVGRARHFNAGDTISAGPIPVPAADFTIAAWFKWTTNPSPYYSGIHGGGGSWELRVMAYGGFGATFYQSIGPDVFTEIWSPLTYNDGIWHHAAAVLRSGLVELYVDGVLVAQDTTNPISSVRMSTQTILGQVASNFVGDIDEVSVYFRALTAAEVGELKTGTEKGFYQKTYFDSLGRATRTMRRDLFGALTSWESFAHNFRDQVVSHTVARNASGIFTTTAVYDFLGRPTTITPPGGGGSATFAYDDVNRIRTAIAENGRKVQHVFDFGGRTTAVREYYSGSSYYTTSYAYDDVGNLVSVTNALNQVTTHQYDNLNRLKQTTYPDTSKFEQYTYDPAGNLKTRRDRANQMTTYSNDSRYRTTGIDYSTTGANPDILYGYDLDDNPTSVTTMVAPSTTVTYIYDGLDRVLTETTLVGSKSYPVDYAFDRAGRVTRLTYPHNADNSRSWVDYVYDAVGRTSSVKDASTTFATFAYHGDDLIKNVTLDNGVLDAYQYNARGWPTRIRATNTPGGQTTYLDLAYAYDASGNVLSMGSSTFTYDGLDRLASASGGSPAHSYVYDAIGNRKAISYGGATLGPAQGLESTYVDVSTTWTTNPTDGQPWTVGAVNAMQAGIELDSTNWTDRVTQVYVVARVDGVDVTLRPNGPGATTQWLPGGAGSANWDRVDDAPSHDGDSTYVYSGSASTRDLYSFQDLGGGTTVSQVTVVAIGRVRDPPCDSLPPATCWGNLRVVVGGSSTSYVYAAGSTGMNTLSSMTTVVGVTSTFAYDANGNMISKFGPTKTCYGWSPENLLTTVKTVTSACADPGTAVQDYLYDGLGRRVNATMPTGSPWTVSIVAGMDAIFERDHSNAITKYVYANGMRIAKINPDASVHYFLSDHQGSTRKVLNSARGEVASFDYEPFGKPIPTPPTATETYKYTMEKHDDPTGLVYLRARQYDPEIGRFVSADPVLGSLGMPQSLNRYSYVANNPLKYTDPNGLFFLNPPPAIDCLVMKGLLTCEAEFRAQADYVMIGAGFIPGVETVSDSYFLFWSTVDLIRAPSLERFGWAALDFASLMVPGVSFGTWARTGRVGANVVLPFLMGLVRRADNVPTGRVDDLLRGIGAPRWPATADEMDALLGFRGTRVPDLPSTPGRGQTVWQIPGSRSEIVFEQHPYLKGVAQNPAKLSWHWHIRPGRNWYVGGDPMPDWLVRTLRGQGIL